MLRTRRHRQHWFRRRRGRGSEEREARIKKQEAGRKTERVSPSCFSIFASCCSSLMAEQVRDVVEGHEEEQACQQDDAGGLKDGLGLEAERAATDFFQNQQQEVSAVDDRQRQEIGHGQVH